MTAKMVKHHERSQCKTEIYSSWPKQMFQIRNIKKLWKTLSHIMIYNKAE